MPDSRSCVTMASSSLASHSSADTLALQSPTHPVSQLCLLPCTPHTSMSFITACLLAHVPSQSIRRPASGKVINLRT